VGKTQLQLFQNDVHVEGSLVPVWRPIHYLGSKLRLVDYIRQAVERVNPHGSALCDLFAGSGTVSAAFATTRDVFAADIQEYSRVLCSAVLNPARIEESQVETFLTAAFGRSYENCFAAASALVAHEERCRIAALGGDMEPICDLMEHASIFAFRQAPQLSNKVLMKAHQDVQHRLVAAGLEDAPETQVLRYFGGLYFSYVQALDLDGLLTAAHMLDLGIRDTFLAAAISTASEVVNTVGKHFAQPIRPRDRDRHPKKHLIAKILRDRRLDVRAIFAAWLKRYRSMPPAQRRHATRTADYIDTLAGLDRNAGVVYADPPYTREHYSRFYHVLETMCRRDDPNVSTSTIRSKGARLSRGMYRADRHQSPFCIRSQAGEAFNKLFSGVRDVGVPMVLSYSPYAANKSVHPRVMTIEALKSMAEHHFPKVEIVSAGRLMHSKLNTTRLNLEASAEAELLLLCS
jgi:hypothetical protein